MKWAAAGCLVASISASASPLVAFQHSSGCPTRLVRISASGLTHQDWRAFPQSTAGLAESFSRASKRAFVPQVQSTPEDHWDHLLCSGQTPEEYFVDFNHLLSSTHGDRQRQLDLLDGLISVELEQHPDSALFVLSSHPQTLQKRQFLDADEQEMADALNDLEFEPGFGEQPTPTAADGLPAATGFDAFQDVPSSASSAASSAVSSIFSGSSASASSAYPSSSGLSSGGPSAAPTVQPLPSHAPFLDKYQILTPNLLFATFIFFLVLFPAGWYSISALSGIQAPFGLENKMQGGGVSQDKKDQ